MSEKNKSNNIDEQLSVSMGIDAGHSAVKYGWASVLKPLDRQQGIFPTYAIPYMELSDAETARRAETDTVKLPNGMTFFIGDTAKIQGVNSGIVRLEKDWIRTNEHDALLVGAFLKNMRDIREKYKKLPAKIEVVLGLPTKNFPTQAEELKTRAIKLFNAYLEVGQQLNVHILTQSQLPLVCYTFKPNGAPKEGALMNYDYGILEFGHKTLDGHIWRGGQIVESSAMSYEGAHLVHQRLQTALNGNQFDVTVNGFVSDALHNRKAMHYGQELDLTEQVKKAAEAYVTQVRSKATEMFGHIASQLKGIIIAGGAVSLVEDALKEDFQNIILIPDVEPRYVVMEGQIRFGLYMILVNNAKQQ